jgi:hypothetical protein
MEMSATNWEKRVLDELGAAKRVAELEDELRLAADQQRSAAREATKAPRSRAAAVPRGSKRSA